MNKHQKAQMSFSKPFSPYHIYYHFHAMIIIIAIFHHEHSNFIEDNEEFKLGGEDLENSTIFLKNFKNLNSKNSYFPNFYHSSPP